MRVMVDGRPLTDSDKLWSYRAWQLGRMEVVYQRSAVAYPFDQSFMFVRLYTLPYLARVAARATHLCDHVTDGDIVQDPHLAALCVAGR